MKKFNKESEAFSFKCYIYEVRFKENRKTRLQIKLQDRSKELRTQSIQKSTKFGNRNWQNVTPSWEWGRKDKEKINLFTIRPWVSWYAVFSLSSLSL